MPNVSRIEKKALLSLRKSFEADEKRRPLDRKNEKIRLGRKKKKPEGKNG